MKKAILFGASGFIGGYLLEELLADPLYEQVTVVVRREMAVAHPKLRLLIGDLAHLNELKDKLIADDVFIALGTTRKRTPDLQEYYKIDHDYPVQAAQIARQNGAKTVCLVTAVGADSRSNVFYIRTKGDAERDIIALNFDHTHIFRPSMLMGNRKEFRLMEKCIIGIWAVLNPLIAGKRFSKYKGIKGSDVARAMRLAANRDHDPSKVNIYHWREMKEILLMC
jgi:uncharacterized protein YbjT (DUF2867 family)